MNTQETAVVYYPAPEQLLTPEEVREALGLALDSSPRLQAAMRQLLGERLARRTIDAAHPKATQDERAYTGGRIQEILSLQGELAAALAAVRELRAKQPRKRRG